MKNNKNFEIENYEKIIKEYLLLYKDKKLTLENLKKLSQNLVEYCKLTRHADCTLKMPSVEFEDVEEDGTLGYYNRKKNTVAISNKFLDKILSYDEHISKLFDAIGHEMQHYAQNSELISFNELPAKKQERIKENARNSVYSYKNYFKLERKDVQILHKLLAPYLKLDEILEGYSNQEDFYKDISYASYHTILSEKEAREEGKNFANSILLNVYFDSSNREDKSFIAFERMLVNINGEKENKLYDENVFKLGQFKNKYSASEDIIIEIVKRLEGDNKQGKLEFSEYLWALIFLITDKSLKERESLLKNAMFNGFNNFEEVLIYSIQNDINFNKNRDKISTIIIDTLTGTEDDKNYKTLPISAYKCDFLNVLGDENFYKLIQKLIKFNARGAANLIEFSNLINFSNDLILKYQQDIKRDKNLSDKIFFRTVFEKISIEQKLEILKSGKLDNRYAGDLLYALEKDEKFPLLNKSDVSIIKQAYQELFDQNVDYIKIIPVNFQTREMWAKFAKKYPLAVTDGMIPEHFQTKEMWLDAANANPEYVAGKIENMSDFMFLQIDRYFIKKFPEIVQLACQKRKEERRKEIILNAAKNNNNPVQMGE